MNSEHDDDEADETGDRNGEPSESDWGCALLVIVLACVVGMLAIAYLGAALSDGPWSCKAPCV